MGDMVDKDAYTKVCAYLVGLAHYAATQDERLRLLKGAYGLYLKNNAFYDALRLALKLNDHTRVTEVFGACEGDRAYLKQLCFLLARQKYAYDFEDDDELRQIASGELL